MPTARSIDLDVRPPRRFEQTIAAVEKVLSTALKEPTQAKKSQANLAIFGNRFWLSCVDHEVRQVINAT